MKSKSLFWILGGVILLCMCIVPVTASCTLTADSGTVTLGNGVHFHGTCDGSETVVYLMLTGPNMPSAGANMQVYDLPNSPVENGNSSTFLAVPVTGGSWSTTWWTQFFVLNPGTYTVYMDTAPISPPVSSETYSLVLERDFSNADIAVSSVPAGADVYFDTLYIGVPTNMTFHGWRTGDHTVGVFKDGYYGQQSTETLTAGTTTTVSFTLVPIPAPGPYIDIGAAGDHRYYFGETIKFSGNNSASGTTYLFMTGPGLPAGGARLNFDPKNSPVEDGNASSFTQANVTSGKWSYYWPTTEMPKFDVGIYNIAAVTKPNITVNLSPNDYHGTSIILQEPFISATANRRTGPAGTVFHIMGTREGGASPNYYANIFVTNNTPSHVGSLPQNGVNPDDFSIESISGDNSTFGRAWVGSDATFDYIWDTGNIAGGSVLPGGVYLFGVAMYPLNLTDVNGYWTKLSIGIEGPVTADYVVDTSSGTAPLTVTFYDNSQGFPTQLNLSFGDGTWDNSTSWMYTHTYHSPGTFTPVLYASNSISSDPGTNATITVNVATGPVTCGAVISSPGVYQLQNDCSNAPFVHPWDGITITSSDVELDGMGHTINGFDDVGWGGVYGVNVSGPIGAPLSNIHVKNVTVNGTYQGIYYYATYGGVIKNITGRNNYYSSVFLQFSNLTMVTNSTATNDGGSGFGSSAGFTNTLMNNVASNNERGFGIYYGRNNNIVNNTIEDNHVGIYLLEGDSPNNNIVLNIIRNNDGYGIQSDKTGDNNLPTAIWNNYFSNENNTRFVGFPKANIWNTTNIPGTNIIGGSSLGGNYWANASGTEYSQKCIDPDKNGICDIPYTIATGGNIDVYPLTALTKPAKVITHISTYYDLTGKTLDVAPYVLIPGSIISTIGIHSTLTMPDYPGYVGFIDENPEANWDHNATVVYVEDKEKDPRTTEYTVSSQLADVDLSYGAGVPPDPNRDTSGGFKVNAQGVTGGSISSLTACTPDCNHYYALLLSGGIRKEANYARYRNDISYMFRTLNVTYGYPKSHITVLMSDGTDPTEDQLTGYDLNNKPMYANSNPDLDGGTASVDVKSVPATRTNVLNTLADLRSTLGQDDNLFIFTTTHGANMHTGEPADPYTKDVVLYLWGTDTEGWISDADFVNALPGSPSYPGKPIKSISIMMEQCFGGGFIDNFIDTPGWATQMRVIATAANWTEYSWGNAFSFQWISGVAGSRLPMSGAWDYAQRNDRYFTAYSPPKETPQFFPANAGTTQYLADCSVAPSLIITEPQAWTWYTGQKHEIKWTQAALKGTPVNIELWKNTFPGTKVLQIAAVTLDDQPTGKYTWDPIPTTLAASTYYWIKINRTDILDAIWRSEGFLTINKARGVATGKLWVNTTPIPTAGNAGGARFSIEIDGVAVPQKIPGTDTYNLTNSSVILPSGTYYVAVGGLGGPEDLIYYGVLRTPVDVPQGTISLNLPMQPIKNYDCPPFGIMDISSDPNVRATVLDQTTQKIYGVYKVDTIGTQIQIAPGTYTVTAEADGYKTATQKNVVIIPSVVHKPCDVPGNERPTFVKFNLEQISEVPVPAIVKIVPRSLNLASNGYFMAFVTLPSGYKAADVIPGSVVCEGATALKLVRHKLFPKTFVAIFRRSDLWDIPTGNSVPMTVTGSILQTTGNPVFSGSDSIKVIRTKVAKEDTDDWGKMTDEKVFSQFNPGYTKDDEKVFSQFNQKDNKNNGNGQANQRDDKNNGKDNGKSK